MKNMRGRTSLKKQPTAFFLVRIIFKKFQTKKERTLITLIIASTLRESSVVEKSNARAPSSSYPFVAVVPNRARAREHFFCIDAISGLLLDRRYNRELEGKEFENSQLGK
jgi:hypothetical protein